MRELACNYSTVRFLPYRETGEFVNVGVVVSCPEIGFFDFKLAPARLRRVKGFFPELNQNILTEAVQSMDATLRSRRNNGALLGAERDIQASAVTASLEEFRWLLKRRETLLHFADPGALVTRDPKQALIDLYDRLVKRKFAQLPEYQEIVMQRRLAGWLKDWNLSKAYKRNKVVGTELFHTVLPFVHVEHGKALRAIKPLDLNRSETTAIFEHGGAWVQRMRRLRSTGGMPEKVFFTVGLPVNESLKKAADDICTELRQSDVEVIGFDQDKEIRRLAAIS